MALESKQTGTEPPQPAQATAARKPARSTGPVIMVAGLFLAIAAVLFVPLMAGGATSAQSSSAPVSRVETVVPYQSVPLAAEDLGYEPALPAVPESTKVSAINVLDGKVLEVVYSLNGTELVYRTAKGSDDLSGDYNEYAYAAIDETDGVARSYQGAAEGTLNLAVWASEGHSYSLRAEGGIEAEVLHALAQSL